MGGQGKRAANLDRLGSQRRNDVSSLAEHEAHVAAMNHPVHKRAHEKSTSDKAQADKIAQVVSSNRST